MNQSTHSKRSMHIQIFPYNNNRVVQLLRGKKLVSSLDTSTAGAPREILVHKASPLDPSWKSDKRPSKLNQRFSSPTNVRSSPGFTPRSYLLGLQLPWYLCPMITLWVSCTVLFYYQFPLLSCVILCINMGGERNWFEGELQDRMRILLGRLFWLLLWCYQLLLSSLSDCISLWL